MLKKEAWQGGATRDSLSGTFAEARCRDGGIRVEGWPVWGRTPGQRGALVLERMVARESACLRRLAGGDRAEIVRFGRFLANERVTVERLVEGWGEQAAVACAGRHVLAIQDSSEINFRTTAADRRGLGKIGKGGGYGLMLHAMAAVDAERKSCLGLVAGRVWTRDGLVQRPHAERLLRDKESGRWLDTATAAKQVLAEAAMVTVVADRESDIYAEWARLPEANFHLLTRAMHDRALVGGGKLSTAKGLRSGGTRPVTVRERPNQPERETTVALRFGRVALKRPNKTPEPGLPASVQVSLIEITEPNPPAGAAPLVWRLLTTHEIADEESAWRIVGWYRQRWTIEQLFRTLKQQGLQLEDSQVETADRLLKLTALAAHAACIILQLVHARDGTSGEAASLVFTSSEIAALEHLIPQLEGRTALQKNPHPRYSLAWAAWAIAKLGGWDGYPKSKPPGPITFRHGLQYFQALAAGWALRWAPP
jgi:hypothetical protein